MATILVDYENVIAAHGLEGAKYLNENDTLIIFFSEPCRTIKAEDFNYIKQSGCKFNICELVKTGKNGLDFYIASTCGMVSQQGEKHIAIISRDKGFYAVVDFFSKEEHSVQVVVAPNIAKGLVTLSDDNSYRKRCILETFKTLNLQEEFEKYTLQQDLYTKINEALQGTKHESLVKDVTLFVEDIIQTKQHANRYTETLHRFGRATGTELYRILKEIW